MAKTETKLKAESNYVLVAVLEINGDKVQALISKKGDAPKKYEAWKHVGCPAEGYNFTEFQPYGDATSCTECNDYYYFSIGD